jgi:prolyl oligopeptidase
LITTGAAAQDGKPMNDPAGEPDPYLWLEDVTGERALDWVRSQNARTQQRLESDPNFEKLREDLLAILDSDEKIPYVEKLGAHYYNFWRDAAHPRGVWRRTTPEEYRKAEPDWELLIDVDALNKAEGENWVWHGADCLKPQRPEDPYERCLIALSRGGADADVTREFDLSTKTWVEGGFLRPEAKGGLGWIDRDTVYLYTDFGEGSLTESGYPRIVKQWRRGTPMDTAETVYKGRAEDVYIDAWHDDTRGHEHDIVRREIEFYSDEHYLRSADGELRKIDVPNSVEKHVHRDWLLLFLREPYTAGGRSYPAGALIAAKLDAFLEGQRQFYVLYEPTPTSSLAQFAWTLNHLLLNVLDNVQNRILVLTPPPADKRSDPDSAGAIGAARPGSDPSSTHSADSSSNSGAPNPNIRKPGTGWTSAPLTGLPPLGTLSVQAVDDEASDEYFLTATDFITPTALYLGSVGSAPARLKSLPAFFDASGLEVTQDFARSKDGTEVPYFVVARADLMRNGDNPTLLFGYGGFEIAITPSYAAAVGRGWLSLGGVYVVANIRGGGEFGPRWHQAALKANRHKAYEDFAAVANDLIRTRLTRPERLGIQGGSNGGLLMGNMLTQYPKLFGAVVCQVPLLDMRRYHKLLAGASWMAEYGDPDDPKQWAFIRTFSPYQNVRRDIDYPPVLFTTSTRDDRVHPGHARKMTARMSAQGHDVLYYENVEGGHGGAADNRQQAYMQALAFMFLKQHLMGRR